MAERTRLRQCIGTTIVYFLNRQGGSNLRIFGGFTSRCLIKKSIRCANILALQELRTAFYPCFAYSSRKCLLLKLKQMEIDCLQRNATFKFKMTLDRHNARPNQNYCVLPGPPHFSLPSTFKPKWHSLRLLLFQGPKKSQFSGPNPSSGPRN